MKKPQPNEAPKAGEYVECVLEGGSRVGPLEVVSRTGEHALVRLASGIAIPLPLRALQSIAPKKSRRAGSGERQAIA